LHCAQKARLLSRSMAERMCMVEVYPGARIHFH
jgi:hypothetical protein